MSSSQARAGGDDSEREPVPPLGGIKARQHSGPTPPCGRTHKERQSLGFPGKELDLRQGVNKPASSAKAPADLRLFALQKHTLRDMDRFKICLSEILL